MPAEMAYPSILVGLPSSGKTSFIAALWNALRDGDSQGKLMLDRLDGDDEHLDSIRERWLACEPQVRTITAGGKYPRMNLVDRDGTRIRLTLPDLSGEVFRDAISDRRWSRPLDEAISISKGVLLFLHPEEITVPIRIDQVRVKPAGAKQPPIWSETQAASQAKLVDLLQLILARQDSEQRRRLALICSAWDVVMPEDRTPYNWIMDIMPLLGQFITANDGLFSARVYGVSAYGGDPERDREVLLLKQPAERIRVLSDAGESHDITEPLSWLLTGS
jgi:hypothetical protein